MQPEIQKTKAVILKRQLNAILDVDAVTIAQRHISHDNHDGKLLVRVQFLSIDPYIRNRLTTGQTRYISSLQAGDTLISMGIAEVLTSFSNQFKQGDHIIAMLPWQEYAYIPANNCRLLPITQPIPTTYHLGLLRYPGLTAYVGIELAKLQPNQTVYVSSAAGTVGHIAGQLAKLKGCRVIGSAGTDRKAISLTKNYQFDAAFNYKKYHSDYHLAFKEYCPKGIDVNFENVGGKILEAAIEHLKLNSKVILCGAISQYNTNDPFKGAANFNKLSQKNAQFIPYIVTDYDHLYAQFFDEVSRLYLSKQINYKENIVHGLDNAWHSLIDLFQGKYQGKVIIAVYSMCGVE